MERFRASSAFRTSDSECRICRMSQVESIKSCFRSGGNRAEVMRGEEGRGNIDSTHSLRNLKRFIWTTGSTLEDHNNLSRVRLLRSNDSSLFLDHFFPLIFHRSPGYIVPRSDLTELPKGLEDAFMMLWQSMGVSACSLDSSKTTSPKSHLTILDSLPTSAIDSD